jgi:hypothetical protein
MPELTLETLRVEIDALRAELRAMKDAHEELLSRYERFAYVSPEAVAALERGNEELDQMRREREGRSP